MLEIIRCRTLAFVHGRESFHTAHWLIGSYHIVQGDSAQRVELATNEQNAASNDKAGQLLTTAGHTVVVTAEDNRRVLRKIDSRILPVLLVVYFLQYLDKGSLSYASVFGILDQAHLEGQEYS